MAEQLYTWIRDIAFYMIIITVVQSIIPGTEYQKYIKFYAGLVLIIITMAPLMKLGGAEDDFLRRLRDTAQRFEEEEKEREKLMKEAQSRIFSFVIPKEDETVKPEGEKSGP